MPAIDTPELSIVIPAFNEAERLPSSCILLQQFCDQFPLAVEILIILEKSTDGTLEACQSVVKHDARFHLIANTVRRGKGFAVRCGMMKAAADIVFFMDADLSTSLSEISNFLEHFQQHPETQILIGSRALSESSVGQPQSKLRQSMGMIFNKIARLLQVAETDDTQCGFKAFRLNAAREVFSRQKLDGFSFDVEVLLLAKALGLKVDVLPINWANSPDSRVNIATDSLSMLWDLLRVRQLVKKTLVSQPGSAPQN